MKKKMIAGILLSSVAVLSSAGSVFAHGHGGNYGYHHGSVCSYGTYGIYGTYVEGYCPDEDSDGICDNCGREINTQGRYFVDVDNDGVCDNYGSGSWSGHQAERGHGCGGGRSR